MNRFIRPLLVVASLCTLQLWAEEAESEKTTDGATDSVLALAGHLRKPQPPAITPQEVRAMSRHACEMSGNINVRAVPRSPDGACHRINCLERWEVSLEIDNYEYDGFAGSWVVWATQEPSHDSPGYALATGLLGPPDADGRTRAVSGTNGFASGNVRPVYTMQSAEYHLHLYAHKEDVIHWSDFEGVDYCDVAEAVGFVKLDDNDRVHHAHELSSDHEVGSDLVTEGRLDYEGDVDWFMFDVPSGLDFRREEIETEGRTDTFGLLMYRYEGQDFVNGRYWGVSERDDNGGDGSNFSLDFHTSSGVRYVRVSHGDHPNGTGDYTLRVRGIGGDDGGGGSDDDHGDTLDDATRLSLPSSTSGAIDPGDDEDYFRFDVSRRGTLTAETSGSLDTIGAIYDSAGDVLASDDDDGTGYNFSIQMTLDAGTYYVRVASHQQNTGAYELHLEIEYERGEDVPDLVVDSLSTNRSEVDSVAHFVLTALVRNQGDAESSATTIGYYRVSGNRRIALGEGSIRALGPSRAQSDTLRVQAESAPGSYTYNACVEAVSGESNTSNNCGSPVRVRVREPQEDDHGDSRATATRVGLPSTTAGVIGEGDDVDYFRFEMSGEATVAAETTGNLDTVGTIYDSRGNRLATDDDGGTDLNFRMAPELDAGTYYVRVGSFGDSTGNYALRLGTEEDAVRTRSWTRLGDLDGDGRDDVLLRRTDGRWYYYPMEGRRPRAGRGSAGLTKDLAWSVAGVGDFDGDGKDDVLLRKTDGRWFFYPMDGRNVLGGRGTVRMTPDLAWQVAGIGDLDGDGRDDVLMRHEDGRWHYYRMNGRRPLSGSGSGRLTADLNWQMAGVGDFDGDGRDDVLLRRRDDGRWYFYPMNGRASIAGRGTVPLTRDLAWAVVGVGDFDGDGRDDVLMRNADGRWYYYPMNGPSPTAGRGPANLTRDLAWSAAGIGDLNGDGRDDVLMRHADGRWYYYPMRGSGVMAGRGSASLTKDLAWRIVATP